MAESMEPERNEMIDLLMVFPRKANVVSRIISSKYMKDSRIKPYHLMLVNGVGNSDGVSQKDLRDQIPFDKSYISVGVRELIDMGYMVNEGQGKVHCLKLTDSGRDLQVMSDMMFDLVQQSIVGLITEEEREELVRILRKISVSMDEIIQGEKSSDSAKSQRVPRWAAGRFFVDSKTMDITRP